MQTDLFARSTSALAVYAPPPPPIGRLLGWVYPGDTRRMYGQIVTCAHAVNLRWAWWRKYREWTRPVQVTRGPL